MLKSSRLGSMSHRVSELEQAVKNHEEPCLDHGSEIALIVVTLTALSVSRCYFVSTPSFYPHVPCSFKHHTFSTQNVYYYLLHASLSRWVFSACRPKSSWPACRGLLSAYSVEFSGGHVYSKGGSGSHGRMHCRLEARYAC